MASGHYPQPATPFQHVRRTCETEREAGQDEAERLQPDPKTTGEDRRLGRNKTLEKLVNSTKGMREETQGYKSKPYLTSHHPFTKKQKDMTKRNNLTTNDCHLQCKEKKQQKDMTQRNNLMTNDCHLQGNEKKQTQSDDTHHVKQEDRTPGDFTSHDSDTTQDSDTKSENIIISCHTNKKGRNRHDSDSDEYITEAMYHDCHIDRRHTVMSPKLDQRTRGQDNHDCHPRIRKQYSHDSDSDKHTFYDCHPKSKEENCRGYMLCFTCMKQKKCNDDPKDDVIQAGVYRDFIIQAEIHRDFLLQQTRHKAGQEDVHHCKHHCQYEENPQRSKYRTIQVDAHKKRQEDISRHNEETADVMDNQPTHGWPLQDSQPLRGRTLQGHPHWVPPDSQPLHRRPPQDSKPTHRCPPQDNQPLLRRRPQWLPINMSHPRAATSYPANPLGGEKGCYDNNIPGSTLCLADNTQNIPAHLSRLPLFPTRIHSTPLFPTPQPFNSTLKWAKTTSFTKHKCNRHIKQYTSDV